MIDTFPYEVIFQFTERPFETNWCVLAHALSGRSTMYSARTLVCACLPICTFGRVCERCMLMIIPSLCVCEVCFLNMAVCGTFTCWVTMYTAGRSRDQGPQRPQQTWVRILNRQKGVWLWAQSYVLWPKEKTWWRTYSSRLQREFASSFLWAESVFAWSLFEQVCSWAHGLVILVFYPGGMRHCHRPGWQNLSE